MHCKIVNNAGMDLGDLEQHVQGMYQHFDKQIGFNKPPTIFFDSDPSNASNTLGKTAYYDPQTLEIHVFVDDRHPKDMLRSIAHELIHHQQNLEGRLDVGGYHGEGYYLHNEALKELEQEAMLEGNHYLREYEDMIKTGAQEMSLKEWKNKELFENLMSKWGIKTNILNEKKEFPDLTGDGKVTQADILKGRGVELDEGHTDYTDPMTQVDLIIKSGKRKESARPALEKMAKEDPKRLEQIYVQSLDFARGQVALGLEESEQLNEMDFEEASYAVEAAKEELKALKRNQNKMSAEEYEKQKQPIMKKYFAAKRIADSAPDPLEGDTEEQLEEAVINEMDFEEASYAVEAAMEELRALKRNQNKMSAEEYEKQKQPIMKKYFAAKKIADSAPDPLEGDTEEQLDEILGVAAMAGGAAALVALIGKYVGISQEKAKKFKAYLEANPEIEKNFEILKRKIEVGFKGAQSDYAKYYRKVIATKDYKEFEPKKVDEVSTAAGGVVGAPRKEELQESINSILKENKKLIKRLLK